MVHARYRLSQNRTDKSFLRDVFQEKRWHMKRLEDTFTAKEIVAVKTLALYAGIKFVPPTGNAALTT